MNFFITGVPAPGGSKSAIPVWRGGGKELVITWRNGRPWPVFNMVDAGGERNEEWRKQCAAQARAFMGGVAPFECPLKVEFIFYLRRPNADFGTGRNAGILKPTARKFHAQKPDALKLARSTEDALTGIVWADDSQTIRVCSEKRWCAATEKSGCAVTLFLIE